MKRFSAPQWFIIFSTISLAVPLAIALQSISSGSIPFWYDPSRDLMQALGNLQKITLIGPPSGIPGIFYGPYWIWWLSFALLFSRDPRIVSLVVQMLPYFLLFPFVLYSLTRLLQTKLFPLFAALYLISFTQFTTELWNPHLAPLFSLCTVTLLLFSEYATELRKAAFLAFLAGIAGGLMVQFHISFGIGAILGVGLFLVGEFGYFFLQTKQKKQKVSLLFSGSRLLLYPLGVFTTLGPFFLFELRHGFHQSQTALNVLMKHGDVVSQHGLTKMQIITEFFGRFATLMELPFLFGIAISIIIVSIVLYGILTKKIILRSLEKKFFSLLACIILSVLTLYLTSKNPIWDYHFIGVEMIFLLLLLLITKVHRILGIIFCLWVGLLIFLHLMTFFVGPQTDFATLPVLSTKEHIVNLITSDAGKKQYAVAVHEPAGVAYDYSYLFLWKADKHISANPDDLYSSQTVYLIIPKTSDSIRDDYIHYETPVSLYYTASLWQLPDGTTIIKRVK